MQLEGSITVIRNTELYMAEEKTGKKNNRTSYFKSMSGVRIRVASSLDNGLDIPHRDKRIMPLHHLSGYTGYH